MFLDKMPQGFSTLPKTLILACFAICYVSVVISYRLYFHPLAKFPGPFWARISGFPAYLQTRKWDRHIWFWDLQQRYGPIVRISPNSLMVNTTTGYKQIFNPKANVCKSTYYKIWPHTTDAINTWNTTDKTIHARKRRVLSACFSDKALRNAEVFIHENLDRWCEILHGGIAASQQSGPGKGWSDSMNMADEANHLIFDILGDLCFGKSFEMKEEGSQLRHVPELMTAFLKMLHPLAHSPLGALWVWLKPRGLDRILAATAPAPLAAWAGFVLGCLNERAKLEKDLQASNKPEAEIRKDFFHYLFRATDPETGGPGYDLAELFGESELLIIAGSDTTAISTAAAMFYLAHNQDVQNRVAEELAEAFSSVAEIKGGMKLQADCKYLQAFIKETLRMSPPVPGDPPREVLPDGLVVDGHWIHAGTVVSTCCYCMHLDETLYDAPFEFRPERWIVGEKGSTEESVARAESGYMPFSVGPRSCPGKPLAYLEMSLILGRVLYQFEVRQTPGTKNVGGGDPSAGKGRRVTGQYQVGDMFVGARDGPIVQFKRRSHQ